MIKTFLLFLVLCVTCFYLGVVVGIIDCKRQYGIGKKEVVDDGHSN